MDEVLRRTILTRHNSQRNVLALGGSDDFKRPQAADMATMVNETVTFMSISYCTQNRDFNQLLHVCFHQFRALAMG